MNQPFTREILRVSSHEGHQETVKYGYRNPTGFRRWVVHKYVLMLKMKSNHMFRFIPEK